MQRNRMKLMKTQCLNSIPNNENMDELHLKITVNTTYPNCSKFIPKYRAKTDRLSADHPP